MKRSSTLAILAALAALVWAPSALAQAFDITGSTNMQLVVGPEAAIQIDTATTSLTTSGGTFANPYTGSTAFTYKIRTSKGSGNGSVDLRVTTDFNPAGGPSVATPAGDPLQYTCSVGAPGTACSGTQTALTTGNTPVATFGSDARSAKNGNSGNTVSWTLPNDPVYSTGTYQAVVLLTISVV